MNRPGAGGNRPGISRPDIGGGNTNIGGGDWNIGNDVDIDVGHDYGYGGWPGYAAGVVTGAALGTSVSSIPTSSCWQTYAGGVTYYNCDGTYYQPYYEGSSLNYQVVAPPY